MQKKTPPIVPERPSAVATKAQERAARVVWYRYGDGATMMEDLAGEITARLAAAVGERRAASLVLPGGATPRPLYRLLACRDIDWPAVKVLLGDERWVAEDDPASNGGVWRRAIAGTAAAAADIVSLHVPGPAHAREALEIVARRLAAVPRPFDVAVLGMGEDGHVASIFPGPGLDRFLDAPLLASPPAPGPAAGGPERVSLGLPLLSDARKLILLVRGEKKRRLLTRVIAEGPASGLPVAHLVARRAAHRAPFEIWWAPAGTENPEAGR